LSLNVFILFGFLDRLNPKNPFIDELNIGLKKNRKK